MIRFTEEKPAFKKWSLILLSSFFFHASIIGALVFMPEKTIERFTSSMDFMVIKKTEDNIRKTNDTTPDKPQKVNEVVKPKQIRKEKTAEPPPQESKEIKKFEMSKESFSGDGNWSLPAQIGDSRIGSFDGSPDGVIKKIQTEDSTPPPPPPPPVKQLSNVIKEKPKVLEEVTIPYPLEAKKLEIEGDVELQVTIDENGRVIKVVILKDPGGGLGDAAARALKNFRFSPAVTEDGRKVTYTIKYTYSFVLD